MLSQQQNNPYFSRMVLSHNKARSRSAVQSNNFEQNLCLAPRCPRGSLIPYNSEEQISFNSFCVPCCPGGSLLPYKSEENQFHPVLALLGPGAPMILSLKCSVSFGVYSYNYRMMTQKDDQPWEGSGVIPGYRGTDPINGRLVTSHGCTLVKLLSDQLCTLLYKSGNIKGPGNEFTSQLHHQIINRRFIVQYSDMENVRNFTRAGLFISGFYPKVVNYVNFKIETKQCNLGANTMFKTFTSLHHVYFIITTTKKCHIRATIDPLVLVWKSKTVNRVRNGQKQLKTVKICSKRLKMPKMCVMVRKMCVMVPKMYVTVPKLNVMVPKNLRHGAENVCHGAKYNGLSLLLLER